jgi:hypothetical protein
VAFILSERRVHAVERRLVRCAAVTQLREVRWWVLLSPEVSEAVPSSTVTLRQELLAFVPGIGRELPTCFESRIAVAPRRHQITSFPF